MDVMLATRNEGKIKEIRQILDGLNMRFLSISDFPEITPPTVIEDEDTYRGNAERKAIAYAKTYNMPAIADDSGLEIRFLGWKPGVHSSRFRSPETYSQRCRWIIKQMKGSPMEQREARFVCSVVLTGAVPEIIHAEGVCNGFIALAEAGCGGFGYDPVFLEPTYGRTFAELDPAEKAAVSHRGRALRALRDRLAR